MTANIEMQIYLELFCTFILKMVSCGTRFYKNYDLCVKICQNFLSITYMDRIRISFIGQDCACQISNLIWLFFFFFAKYCNGNTVFVVPNPHPTLSALVAMKILKKKPCWASLAVTPKMNPFRILHWSPPSLCKCIALSILAGLLSVIYLSVQHLFLSLG